MTNILLHDQAKRFKKAVPEIRTGFTVRVHERIQEGNKERVQVFEGLVISVHKGHTAADASFTVRRLASGIGVEKVFPLHSPVIEKIEVKKVAKVRRSKLFFIRERRGKAARMTERFTNEGEFAAEEVESTEPEVLEETEAPAAEQAEPEAVESAPEVAEAPKEEVSAQEEEKKDEAAA